MAFDYSHLGFSKRLQKLNAPVTRDQKTTGYEFDSLYEIQTKRFRADGIPNLIQFSSVASAVGTVSAGEVVTFTTRLSPGVTKRTLMANPYVSVYQGTAGSSSLQIYPDVGGSIGSDDYEARAGFDYSENHDYNEVFKVSVANRTGTAQPVSVWVRWKYIENGSGGLDQS